MQVYPEDGRRKAFGDIQHVIDWVQVQKTRRDPHERSSKSPGSKIPVDQDDPYRYNDEAFGAVV